MSEPTDPNRPRNTLYRRETRSGRERSTVRDVLYRLLVPVGLGLIRLWWRWSPIRRVVGDEHAMRALATGAVIPVYWHQHQLYCVRYLLDQRERGLKLGFLISPSVDGDLAANLAASVGAHVVRGSANNTGARALRDYYVALQQGLSPSITPDGSTGPRYGFKPGAILIAQMSGRPMLPMSFHATRAWKFRTWDRFVLPVPFSRVVVAVGEPRYVPRGLDAAALQRWQRDMEAELLALYRSAREASAGA